MPAFGILRHRGALFWGPRRGNSLKYFHFLQELNKTKCYEIFHLLRSKAPKRTKNIQFCTKGQAEKLGIPWGEKKKKIILQALGGLFQVAERKVETHSPAKA